MKLKMIIEAESKDLPASDLADEFDFEDIDVGEPITEKNFDTHAATISEKLSEMWSKDGDEKVDKVKVTVHRMGR